MIEPLIVDNPNFVEPTAFVLDSTKENIYITQRYGLVRFNFNTSEFILVAGTNVSTGEKEKPDARDGPLLEARFGGKFIN